MGEGWEQQLPWQCQTALAVLPTGSRGLTPGPAAPLPRPPLCRKPNPLPLSWAALHPTVLLGQSSPLLLSSRAPVSAFATSHSALPSTCFSPKQPLSHLPLPGLGLRMMTSRPSSPPSHSLSIKSILGCVTLGTLLLRSSTFCSTAWSTNDPDHESDVIHKNAS